MAGQELSLEPVKVFTDLSNKISATRTHFGEYSSGVSKLLKLKARPAGLFEAKKTYAPAVDNLCSDLG